MVHNKFGALLKGYKVRRILRQHKVVSQLRVEYRDLIKFAFQLKEELADHMKNNSKAVGPTKLLLVQSVKDLTKKREQFH